MAAERRTRVTKHSLLIAGHSTSISLEDAFWQRLRRVATDRGIGLAALVAGIDAERGEANLSSAIRVFLLEEAVASGAAPHGDQAAPRL